MLLKVVLLFVTVLVMFSAVDSLFTPQDYPKVNLKFFHGPTVSNQSQYLMRDVTQLLSHRRFNPKLRTVLFVSGWTQSPEAETSQIIIKAYLQRGDYNLLVLDWSAYSLGLYSAVMVRISNISRLFGRTMVKLFDKGLNAKSFHCVGHSFGAHSCGIMSRELYQASNRRFKLGRITGLDPAGPGFFPVAYENPLSPKDADFVDAIHSDTFMIGTPFPVGHADFYPNYNMVQPACPPLKLETFYDFINDMCSHFNAIRYWVDSLQPKYENYFPSFRCQSWENFTGGKCKNNTISFMGVAASRKSRGKFFIKLKSSHQLDAKRLYVFLLDRIGRRLVNLANFDF